MKKSITSVAGKLAILGLAGVGLHTIITNNRTQEMLEDAKKNMKYKLKELDKKLEEFEEQMDYEDIDIDKAAKHLKDAISVYTSRKKNKDEIEEIRDMTKENQDYTPEDYKKTPDDSDVDTDSLDIGDSSTELAEEADSLDDIVEENKEIDETKTITDVLADEIQAAEMDMAETSEIFGEDK